MSFFFAPPPSLRFVWSDASPKIGRDWLLSREVAVLAHDLDDVIAAADALSTHSQAILHKHFQDPLELGFREKCNQVLVRAVQSHMHIPVAIGSKAAGVEQKVGAFLHSISAECGKEECLTEYLSSTVSHTTDLGTEVKLADFTAANWTEMLPPHVTGAFESDLSENKRLLGQTHLMPSAIVMPGALHLLDTVVSNVSHAMSQWDRFYAGLKVIEGLLKLWRLDRFFHACSVSDIEQKEFKGAIGASLYEKRWHNVAEFIVKAEGPLSVLRRRWNACLYESLVKDKVGQDLGAIIGPKNMQVLAGLLKIVCLRTGLLQNVLSNGISFLKCTSLGGKIFSLG